MASNGRSPTPPSAATSPAPTTASSSGRLRASPVRVQWDPDRSLTLAPLSHRAIQVGLSGEAVSRYLDQWITSITDITNMVHELHELVRLGNLTAASTRLPAERIYPLAASLGTVIGADQPDREPDAG